ncbi:MAG: hypothetical protein Q4D31_01185, partial [Eubacteriales bacterium]|nr:hypothetical protein [Eubacteriales bacterium]
MEFSKPIWSSTTSFTGDPLSLPADAAGSPLPQAVRLAAIAPQSSAANNRFLKVFFIMILLFSIALSRPITRAGGQCTHVHLFAIARSRRSSLGRSGEVDHDLEHLACVRCEILERLGGICPL